MNIANIVIPVDVVIPIIAGLIGVFIGAYMQRKTQQQNWLLQNRAQVFADLLRTVDRCIDKASEFFRENPKPGIETQQRLIDMYIPAFINAKITRLFAMKSSKARIEELVREIYALHSSKDLGDERFKTLDGKLDELQRILEDNLRTPKW